MTKPSVKNSPEVIKKFGRLEDKEYIAILDLELTCDEPVENLLKPISKMEIIEIGIIIVDLNYNEVSRLSTTCKPFYYTKLTPYCTSLTGISQQEIDQSKGVVTAFNIIADQLPDTSKMVWASWGTDIEYLQKELNSKIYKEQHKIQFDPRYINLKSLYNRKGSFGSLSSIFEAEYGFKPDKTHRAIADCEITLKLLQRGNYSPLDCKISNNKTYRQTLPPSL